jgi:tetratricopeptide (TPR) repeat protein
MDIEGHLIPLIYNEFVRSGDATEMERVLYRNRIDLLSMAALAAHVLDVFADARQLQEPADVYGIARWQAQLGLFDSAEATLRYAAGLDCDIDQWHEILLELGLLIKRRDRRDEAVPLWLQVAHTATSLTAAHIELAKYYEWYARDYEQALHWTNTALALVSRYDWTVRQELDHRAARLTRKLSTMSDDS